MACFSCCGRPKYREGDLDAMAIQLMGAVTERDARHLLLSQGGDIIFGSMQAETLFHTRVWSEGTFNALSKTPLEHILDPPKQKELTPRVKTLAPPQLDVPTTCELRTKRGAQSCLVEAKTITVGKTHFYVIKILTTSTASAWSPADSEVKATSGTERNRRRLDHWKHNLGNVEHKARFALEERIRSGKPITEQDKTLIQSVLTMRCIQGEINLESMVVADHTSQICDYSHLLQEVRRSIESWIPYCPNIEFPSLESFYVRNGFKILTCVQPVTLMLEVLFLRLVEYSPSGTFKIGVRPEGDNLVFLMGIGRPDDDGEAKARDDIKFVRSSSTAEEEFHYEAEILSQVRMLSHNIDVERQFNTVIEVSQETTGIQIRLTAGFNRITAGDLPRLGSAKVRRPERHAANRAQHIRILAVDDERLNRRVISRMFDALITEGFAIEYRVLERASLAMGALEDAASRAHLVFMDIVMPDGISGDEAGYQIKQTYGDEIDLVASTANASAEDQKRYHERGFDSVLPKPFDKLALTRHIGHTQARLAGQAAHASDSDSDTAAATLGAARPIRRRAIKKGALTSGGEADKLLRVVDEEAKERSHSRLPPLEGKRSPAGGRGRGRGTLGALIRGDDGEVSEDEGALKVVKPLEVEVGSGLALGAGRALKSNSLSGEGSSPSSNQATPSLRSARDPLGSPHIRAGRLSLSPALRKSSSSDKGKSRTPSPATAATAGASKGGAATEATEKDSL